MELIVGTQAPVVRALTHIHNSTWSAHGLARVPSTKAGSPHYNAQAFGIAQREAMHPSNVCPALLPTDPNQQELHLPQNTKDSKGGKNKSAKDTGANGAKRTDKGSVDNESGSPVGSQNKGEKKTTN
jgi:hypothetical protein